MSFSISTTGGQILNMFNTENWPTLRRIGRRLWRISRRLYYPHTHTPIVEESALKLVLELADYSSKSADSPQIGVWVRAFIHSTIGAEIYQTFFSYQLHMQCQYTTIQGDMQLSHVNILHIFFQFDLNSLDHDIGQSHLIIFLSFSSKCSIFKPNFKVFTRFWLIVKCCDWLPWKPAFSPTCANVFSRTLVFLKEKLLYYKKQHYRIKWGNQSSSGFIDPLGLSAIGSKISKIILWPIHYAA